MAIGKLLPRIAPPLRAPRAAVDRQSLSGAWPPEPARSHVTGLPGFFFSLVTPPQPFAEAERQASPTPSIIRFPAYCLRIFSENTVTAWMYPNENARRRLGRAAFPAPVV